MNRKDDDVPQDDRATTQTVTNIGEIIAGENLPGDRGLQIRKVFEPFFDDFRTTVEEAKGITPDQPKKAREVRLRLKGIRTGAEKARKELKAESVRTGRAIDGVKALLDHALVPIEKAMDEIEKAEERREAAQREARIQRRRNQILQYDDPNLYRFEDLSEDEFSTLLDRVRADHEAREESERIRREEEERKRREEEEQHKREEEERRRREVEIEEENRRLREEAARREAEEQKKLERERAEKAERERREAEERKARERAEQEAREAREKAERLEREARERERRKREEEERIARIEAQAGDRDRVKRYLEAVRQLNPPAMSEGLEDIEARLMVLRYEHSTKIVEILREMKDEG